MKRKIIFLLLAFCIGMTECYASSANLYSNSTTITKGNNVKVSVTINTDHPMVSVEGALKCSGVVSSTYDLTYDDSSNSLKSKTYTYTLTPTTSGNITCNLQNVRVTHLGSASWETLASSSLKITVNDPPVVVQKPKSTNSFLSSLTVDGYELNTKFDKELLEYSVTVKEGTEKIKVNAQLADSTAKVNGVGEIAVTEGINNISVVVTAENGSKRTYTLKVTVKEFEPINVKINNEEYTVVRHRKNLPKISDYFKEANITIDENVVEGYNNENLNYNVVGLKDKEGNVSYYIYQDGKYTLYNEQSFNGKILRILDKDLPNGYQKTNFKYNDTDINAYQEVKMDIIKNTYALDNNDIEGNPNIGDNICPQEQDYNDALAVCEKLGIELHRVDFIKEYWDYVFTSFLEDYEKNSKVYNELLEVFKKYDVTHFFYCGGNDSMDTCNKISKFFETINASNTLNDNIDYNSIEHFTNLLQKIH